MPSLALGTAAGAGAPIADILDRMMREQVMREQSQRLEEEIRSHRANEGLRSKEIDQMAADRKATRDISTQTQADAERNRLNTEAKSRIALRPIDSIITPEEKASDRGQAPESAYQFQPANMGGTSMGPSSEAWNKVNPPTKAPAGDLAPTPSRFQFTGTEPQLQAQERIDKTGNTEDKTMLRDAQGNYIPRPVVRGLYDQGKKVQGYTPPDRAVVQTDQGFIPRPDVAAAARTGNPAQPKEPAQVLNRRDMATAVGSHFDDAEALLREAEDKGYLGPLAGRTYGEFLAGKVGSTGNKEADELLGDLKMSLGMLSSGVASLHGRSGANYAIAEDIQRKMNSGKMSYELIHGGLKQLRKWTDTYAKKKSGDGAAAAPEEKKGGGLRYDMNGKLISGPGV